MYALPLVQFDVGGDVDDEPTLFETQILHAGPDRGSDDAVGAVAAQDIVGADDAGLATVPVGELHDNMVAAVKDRGDFAVAVEVYAVVPRKS